MDRPLQRIVYATLATVSGLVLLFGYRTSHCDEMTATAPATAGSALSGSTSGSTGASDAAGSTPGSTGSTSDSTGTGGSTSPGLQDGTYTGDSAGTRYGPVQVQITVSGGSISAVDVLDYPSDNPRDRQINQRALPMLISETTSAQSARVDMISGATYTSEGYLQSLQSAIDQAQS
ncbi:FMN-binding protein [Microbacterium esteraromaticum]|uniref:FMN-binding protein n=1 Tax=Microbacterium esteraromaticum TaxID=57043 RepID=UPI0030A54C0B